MIGQAGGLMMLKAISRVCVLLCLATPTFAQTPQSNPFDRVEFFGDILALMGFCGLFHHVDQYEMAMGMKAFDVTSADRPAMEAIRDKRYRAYREKYKTASAHGDFCIQVRSHPFFIKAGRKGSPIVVGSETTKQPEKIELFGNALGAMLFCKIHIDANKWGSFLFDMGVKSESVAALTDQSVQKRKSLVAQYGAPEWAVEFCNQTRADPAMYRFSRQ
jgi:hypothetical protein